MRVCVRPRERRVCVRSPSTQVRRLRLSPALELARESKLQDALRASVEETQRQRKEFEESKHHLREAKASISLVKEDADLLRAEAERLRKSAFKQKNMIINRIIAGSVKVGLGIFTQLSILMNC